MQRCLEGVCEEGEHSFKKLKTSRSVQPPLRPQESPDPPFRLFHQLANEVSQTNRQRGLRRTARILDRLVARERLNTLILNLHPDFRYSLAFRRHSPAETVETTMFDSGQWPHDWPTLLECVDNEQLFPHLNELLERSYSFLYYSGCVIAEVRDHRRGRCETHCVLLRPSLQSLLADADNIAAKLEWSRAEREQFESRVLQANHASLCLDPDNAAGARAARRNRDRNVWNTRRVRAAARAAARRRPEGARGGLLEFAPRWRARQGGARAPPPLGAVPAPRLEAGPLAPPAEPVCINEFKTYQRPIKTSDCLPQLIEEYVLETDMPSKEKGGKVRTYYSKLSIFQRPVNSEYLGELYLDRDYVENERNGVACKFTLGTRLDANRYVDQLTDIFTEGGRKAVRIKYGLSPGYKERMIMAQQMALSQYLATSQQIGGVRGGGEQNSGVRLVNGVVGSRRGIIQANVPLLGHLQGTSQIKPATQVSAKELGISVIRNDIINSVQQYQASVKPSSSHRNHSEIINILNSSTNNDVQQKVFARKLTPRRILNHNNLSVNNNRTDLTTTSQLKTITTVNNTNYNYTTLPIKQIGIANNTNETNPELLSLLVNVPSADHPDIIGTNTSSLLLEKFPSASSSSSSSQSSTNSNNQTHYIQGFKSGLQYIQTPKVGVVSPPPQSTTINFTQLQNLSGLQHVLVSMPVTTSNTSTVTQSTSLGVGGATVVLAANAGTLNFAQLVASKGISQQNIRTSGPSSLQAGHSYQLVQRPKPGQQLQQQQTIPITLKMATQGSNAAQVALSSSQKAQYQQYQQICLNQQQAKNAKLRRRSNTSEQQ